MPYGGDIKDSHSQWDGGLATPRRGVMGQQQRKLREGFMKSGSSVKWCHGVFNIFISLFDCYY